MKTLGEAPLYAVVQAGETVVGDQPVLPGFIAIIADAFKIAERREMHGPLRIGAVEAVHAEAADNGDTYHVKWIGSFIFE